jgi:hypothetical protein
MRARTTDPEAPRARRRRPGAFGIVSASLAAFFVVFALLAWQLGRGDDPALGSAPEARQERPVLVRQIKLTRIVEDPPAPVTNAMPAPASGGTVAVPEGGAAPATSAAPAPAPAAAPAPAPAPVATGSS